MRTASRAARPHPLSATVRPGGSCPVKFFNALSDRRRFLKGIAAGAAAGALPEVFFTVPGAFAQELVRTPAQTEGPFYPDRLPLDTDNDLLIINNSITPAVGEVTHLSGRILAANGSPIRNATVEIWQVDTRGAYLHSDSDN